MGITYTMSTAAKYQPHEKASLIVGDLCIPEILTEVLSHVPPSELLKCSLVCKNWNEIIKNNRLWITIFKRKYPKRKSKQVPWFVYHILLTTNFFDTNLIENGNGEKKFSKWTISKNFGDGFIIENLPSGSPPLPAEVEEFHGNKSCFATSYGQCEKFQTFKVRKNKVCGMILDKYKPHIYASEWTTGRFDCSCYYKMKLFLHYNNSKRSEKVVCNEVEQFSNPDWKKIELLVDDYCEGVSEICFMHQGKDTLFWAGHYGSKMAGAVVKILFDTIKEDI